MIPFDYYTQFRIFKLHLKYKGLKSGTFWRYLFTVLPLIFINHFIHQFFWIVDSIVFPSHRRIPTDDSIFIIGPPRCGTSLFLDLLNNSEDITSMKLWELQLAPSICQKLFYLQLGKLDRWMGSPLYKAYMKFNDKALGDFKKIHDTSLFHFEEDAQLFYHSGNSPYFLFFFPFSELQTPFLDFDISTTPEYRAKYMKYYKRCIQKHLYVFGKNKTFLSKNPLFSFYVKSLKEEFKDVRFIYMIRTPYQVAPSAITLSTYFKGYTQYVDDAFIKNSLLQMLRYEYLYPYEMLDFNDTRHNAMVRFEDLVGDTKATVERVLDQFQMDCPEELQRALAQRSKREKSYVSRNKYSFERFGITEQEFQEHFGEVLMKFGYAEERA